MAVEVGCTPQGDGYQCVVQVSDSEGSAIYQVRVSKADLGRWSRGRSAEQLVRDSFEFLLQRESKASILPEFDLSVIKRYFADYDGGP